MQYLHTISRADYQGLSSYYLEGETDAKRGLEGYGEVALKLLSEKGARIGSKISVKTSDGFEASGILIPRYEGGVGDNIVLKLKSGYNIGISAKTITSLRTIEEPVAQETIKATQTRGKQPDRTVLLLSTGGTIASKVDYRTGAVRPAYDAADLYSSIPELGRVAKIVPEVVFSELSENLSQENWKKLSERILSKSQIGLTFDGIVVMLGTDTMGYVSAALSFSLIGVRFPVVCVGAQRSSDRPSADSALNLLQATRFAACSGVQGVFVAMHKSANDDVIAIHSGVRVRKDHTSRRDAFESVDVPLFAEIKGEEIKRNLDYIIHHAEEDKVAELGFKTNFDPNVFLLKFHPGFEPDLLDYLVQERKSKGFILEGTGLGHVSSRTVQKIDELVRKGTFVGITSQCIRGRVNLNVYETGIDLIEAGAIPLENMLAETAFVKLSWAFGNFPRDKITRIMTENLVGEITERTTLVA